MKVPLLDLKAQLGPIEKEIKETVLEVVDSTRYIMGPRVEELEHAVAQYCGTKTAVGVTSGTDALLMSLMAYDVGPGDIVITTTYSFFATAGVVARLNATPVFLDIDPTNYNIDPQAVKDWFEANPDKADKVKAIIPVHLYGQCADMDPILEVANQYDIPVIEDACQAIGATYPSKNGPKRAGSIGTCGCFSFFPSKNLGCLGDGGMITTNDEELAQKLRMLRNHGETSRYHHTLIGGNFRLDPMQAAVLLVKLPHLDSWHEGRRKNAAYYDANLKVDGLTTPATVYGRENHIYNQYIISVPRDRDALLKHLQDNDIGCAIYYPRPFHLQECFANLGYKQGDLPKSEFAGDHTIALPIYPELTDEMKAYVVEKITEFYA